MSKVSRDCYWRRENEEPVSVSNWKVIAGGYKALEKGTHSYLVHSLVGCRRCSAGFELGGYLCEPLRFKL